MPVLSNARRERFAWLIAAGATLESAYQASGYRIRCGGTSRLRTLGRRLLAAPEIAERVGELTAGAAKAAGGAAWSGMPGRAWVVARLVETVERALQAVPVTDRKGVATGEYGFQGPLAMRGLELLGRELGMFGDRRASEPVDIVAEMSDAELESRARRLVAALGLGGAGNDAGGGGTAARPPATDPV